MSQCLAAFIYIINNVFVKLAKCKPVWWLENCLDTLMQQMLFAEDDGDDKLFVFNA